jgi:SAM-dependent methyltransferase
MNPQETHAAQLAYWNSVAGEKWLKRQAETDAMLQPAQAAAIAQAHVIAGERVLDIGCGCGASTLELAEQVGPSGRVVAVDVSTAMLARARERTRDLAQVECLVADAAAHPFAAESFDLLFSRFGVMFFGDPAAVFAHTRAALKPAGRLVFVCWRGIDENPWMRVPLQAVCKHVSRPPRPGPEDPGPFSFADTARVTRILTEAGFAAPTFMKLDFDLDIANGGGLDAAVEGASTIGAASAALNDQPQDLRDAALGELRATLAPLLKDGRVPLGGAIWIVEAKK